PEPLETRDRQQDQERRHAGFADLAAQPVQVGARRPRGARRRERGRQRRVGDGLCHRLAPVSGRPTSVVALAGRRAGLAARPPLRPLPSRLLSPLAPDPTAAVSGGGASASGTVGMASRTPESAIRLGTVIPLRSANSRSSRSRPLKISDPTPPGRNIRIT